MKRYITIISVLVALLYSGTISANIYKGELNFKNGKLEERDDSLHFNIDVQVSNQAVSRTEGIRIVPFFSTENRSIEMPDVMVQGKNRAKSWERSFKLLTKREKEEFRLPNKIVRVEREGETTFRYSVSLPYQMWMDSAQLTIFQELIKPADERSLVSYSYDGGVEIEAREPYVVSPLVDFIEPPAESKLRKRQGQAFLDFQVGRSNIIANYRRNPEELSKIERAFKEIESDDDVQIVGLYIEGYASPDGRYATNERLSQERAMALKNHIVQHFNVPLTGQQIKVSWTAEDWNGLKGQVESSDLSRKDDILSIIDGTDNIEQRKAKLRALGGGAPYRTMLQDMFPLLRRVEYQIDFTVRDFSIDETKRLIDLNSNLFSHLELYRAAESYEKNSQDYERIMLDVAPRLFNDDMSAHINAAAVMINRGEVATAKRYLERYEDNPQVWNNLGVVYLVENDLDKARELFEKAFSGGVKEAEYNLKELRIKELDNIKMERSSRR